MKKLNLFPCDYFLEKCMFLSFLILSLVIKNYTSSLPGVFGLESLHDVGKQFAAGVDEGDLVHDVLDAVSDCILWVSRLKKFKILRTN